MFFTIFASQNRYKMRVDENLTEIYSLLGIKTEGFKELIDFKKNELNISSDRQLSSLLGINKDTLNRIIKGDSKRVDLISFLKISNFLNLDISKVIKLYVSSLKPELIEEIESNRKANFIVRNFDLDALKKIGFIKNKSNFELIEQRIVNFFGIKDIFEYSSHVAFPLFSKAKKGTKSLMNDFWVKSAYLQFDSIKNPNDFDYESLEDIIPKIRPYTRLEETGLLQVIKALYLVGVTVIIQKYVTKTSVKGACFIVDDKPCIVLTDYMGRYDILWFTLLHELCHVLYDMNDLVKNKYHLSGESDLLLLNEERANQFARSILFSKEKLDYIKPFINNHHLVLKYSEEHNIHPSTIYGFYLYENKDKSKSLYPKFRKYLISSEKAIAPLFTNIWDEENSIKEEIAKIITKIS
jgi:HTH-type transcriptional regulator/antitoxin HigA